MLRFHVPLIEPGVGVHGPIGPADRSKPEVVRPIPQGLIESANPALNIPGQPPSGGQRADLAAQPTDPLVAWTPRADMPPRSGSRMVAFRITTFRGLLGVHCSLRLACSPSRLSRPSTPKAPTASLPPPPLRLLPAGATSCRAGLTPAENPRLSRRTVRKGGGI